MKRIDLKARVQGEIAAFPCQTSLLLTDLGRGETLLDLNGAVRCVAASTIKVPILLCALEEVRLGKQTLEDLIAVPADQTLPDTEVFERGVEAYTLWELLYWMIVESDNTATNVVLNALGFDAVNAYAHGVLGLSDTVCQRKMLDFGAVQAGRNNFTSATDQGRMYGLLHRGDILTPALRETALDMLRRQRSMDLFLRYIPHPVTVAHKTGGLDFLNHDAGIFYLPTGDFYLGIFTWDGPSAEGDSRQKQFIGRLAKMIYDDIQ